MRYNKFSNNYQSEADAQQFFLTDNGKYNPQAEYTALIDALNSPILDNDHAACRFPARSLKLIRDGAVKRIPDLTKCTKLQQYLRATNAKAASLVFAGYFIQKPSSAFGHSFLRLHTNQQGNAALLDFAVDFSATVDTNNPIAYGVKGIIGGFKGRFSRMPYFLKLREYADLESRDVWEYPLNLNREQTSLLVLHLWEMDQAYFNYFYFSENCSYHILRAIEAISGRDISSKLKFFVTPLDTIHALKDSSLLATPKRRPSQHAILTTALNQLDSLQKEEAETFLHDPLAYNKELPKNPKLLDTFIEILNYRFAHELLTDTPPANLKELRHRILTLRSQLDGYSVIEPPSKDDPASGHRGSWFEVRFAQSDVSSLELEHAFAIHSFQHPQKGFSNRFQMVMGRLSAQILDNDMTLSRFDIFDVISASNSFSWDFKPSWRFAMGLERNNYDLNPKPRAYALISSGVSFNFDRSLLFMLNFDLKPRHNPHFKEKAMLPIGPSLLVTLNYKKLRAGVESSYYRELFNEETEFNIEPFLRYQASKEVDLVAKGIIQNSRSSAQLGFTYFY